MELYIFMMMTVIDDGDDGDDGEDGDDSDGQR